VAASGKITVGINYPWFDYGLDFGPAVAAPGGTPKKASPRWDSPLVSPLRSLSGTQLNSQLDIDLDMMREVGIEIVRWFIIADGWPLGTPTYSNGTWSYSLPQKISQDIFDDFRALLEAFKRAKMKIIPVLADFYLFARGAVVLSNAPGAEPIPVTGSFASVDAFVQDYFREYRNVQQTKDLVDWNTYVKGGKGALLTKTDVRADFVKRVFQPLLDVAKPYNHSVVFAWDICNEPDFGVSKYKLRPQELGDFLMLCLQTAIAADACATIGFQTAAGSSVFWGQGSFGDVLLHQYETRQVYYPQYHFYPEDDPTAKLVSPAPGPVPQARSRTILGEFATDFTGASARPWASTWPPDVLKRLTIASDAGFGYAFPWAYNRGNRGWRTDWNGAAWTATKAYTGVP
jgi:hypothetical protein